MKIELHIQNLRCFFLSCACCDVCTLDILFSSNHNIHKSWCGLCFWASEPLIYRFYWNLSIIGSEAQKQWPFKFLWMLWFDEKSISKVLHSKYSNGYKCLLQLQQLTAEWIRENLHRHKDPFVHEVLPFLERNIFLLGFVWQEILWHKQGPKRVMQKSYQ